MGLDWREVRTRNRPGPGFNSRQLHEARTNDPKGKNNDKEEDRGNYPDRQVRRMGSQKRNPSKHNEKLLASSDTHSVEEIMRLIDKNDMSSKHIIYFMIADKEPHKGACRFIAWRNHKRFRKSSVAIFYDTDGWKEVRSHYKEKE